MEYSKKDVFLKQINNNFLWKNERCGGSELGISFHSLFPFEPVGLVTVYASELC